RSPTAPPSALLLEHAAAGAVLVLGDLTARVALVEHRHAVTPAPTPPGAPSPGDEEDQEEDEPEPQQRDERPPPTGSVPVGVCQQRRRHDVNLLGPLHRRGRRSCGRPAAAGSRPAAAAVRAPRACAHFVPTGGTKWAHPARRGG